MTVYDTVSPGARDVDAPSRTFVIDTSPPAGTADDEGEEGSGLVLDDEPPHPAGTYVHDGGVPKRPSVR